MHRQRAAGAFTDAFFFSIETLATVGYGTMAPATLYGHVVSAIEIVRGRAIEKTRLAASGMAKVVSMLRKEQK